MADRTLVPGTRALVVFCASLALLAAGCGEQGQKRDTGRPSPSEGDGNPVSTPTASRPVPSGGKGSKDPDDINGDGHRDLLLPLASPDSDKEVGRTGVVFGSAHGLAPSTHAVYDYRAGTVTTADLDGDGKDGILVATDDGALLIDGDKDRTEVLRQGPARVKGKKSPAEWRHARPCAAADFDADGKEELILNWGPGVLFASYGEHPTQWWITDGTSPRDKAAFATTSFAGRG